MLIAYFVKEAATCSLFYYIYINKIGMRILKIILLIISLGLLLFLLIDTFLNLRFVARMPVDLLISQNKEEIENIQNIDSLRLAAYKNIENNISEDYEYQDNQEHLNQRRFWTILILIGIEILLIIFHRKNKLFS
jgi:hypothetical protein